MTTASQRDYAPVAEVTLTAHAQTYQAVRAQATNAIAAG